MSLLQSEKRDIDYVCWKIKLPITNLCYWKSYLAGGYTGLFY